MTLPCTRIQHLNGCLRHLAEDGAGRFTLIVFCLCSVSPTHGAVGWSAVCACDISWSYALAFLLT